MPKSSIPKASREQLQSCGNLGMCLGLGSFSCPRLHKIVDGRLPRSYRRQKERPLGLSLARLRLSALPTRLLSAGAEGLLPVGFGYHGIYLQSPRAAWDAKFHRSLATLASLPKTGLQPARNRNAWLD